jgi:hypothetical protein
MSLFSPKLFSVATATALLLTGPAAFAEDQPRVGNISNLQQQRLVERVEVLRLWSFAFGPAAATNMNDESLFYSFTLAHHWEVNPNAEIRANLHTTLPTKWAASFSSFGIGGSWIPLTSDISPIIGGEIGYGYAVIPALPNESGFEAGVHGGFRFFRTAAAQMAIEAYAKTIFSSAARPVDYGATLSVLY